MNQSPQSDEQWLRERLNRRSNEYHKLDDEHEKLKAERDSYKEKADELDKIRAAVLAKIGYATVTLNEVVQAIEKAEAFDWLNTVEGMDWVSNCEYGEVTISAINEARKHENSTKI